MTGRWLSGSFQLGSVNFELLYDININLMLNKISQASKHVDDAAGDLS